jgi:hypothetical protein
MTTNLPQIQSSNQGQEQYFDNFYNTQTPITSNQYDAVYTFFLSRTNNNKEAAKSLTTSLLEITHQNSIDPMVVLGDFKKYNQNESFKTALIGLFNGTRRNTSKIGFSAKPVPSQNVMRNIRS